MSATTPKQQLPRTMVAPQRPLTSATMPMNQTLKDEEAPTEYRRGGYLSISIGDKFAKGRYTVVRKLGWGHFSTVWLVKDEQNDMHSALKVVKSATRYTETAHDEIKLLKQIASTEPGHIGHEYIVNLLDSFDHQSQKESHACMIMEPLGETLLTLITRNGQTGVAQPIVKTITKQILLGLQFLHDHCDLVHTDLKPENILIAIPNVQEHIRTELLCAPDPASRNVGIPTEYGHSSSGRRSERTTDRVRIFSSQPLPSPNPNRSPLSQSPAERTSLKMSSLRINDVKNSISPLNSGANSTSTSFGAMSMSTAPTSFRSDTPKLSSQSQASLTEALNSSTITTNTLSSRFPVPKPIPGPSLLSQTAPRKLSAIPSIEQVSEPSTASATPEALTSALSRGESVQDGIFLSPPHLPELPHLFSGSEVRIKIADLGNASPSKVHFTEDIQTRQYRAPEAIIGRSDWDARADIWSVGCLVFEMLTGDLLFEPHSCHKQFTKDDDHMAMIIELLGEDSPFDLEFKMGGKFSKHIFTSVGDLRRISALKPWSLHRVLLEKYVYSASEAQAINKFLLPLLAINPRDRARAAEMLEHEWLDDI